MLALHTLSVAVCFQNVLMVVVHPHFQYIILQHIWNKEPVTHIKHHDCFKPFTEGAYDRGRLFGEALIRAILQYWFFLYWIPYPWSSAPQQLYVVFSRHNGFPVLSAQEGWLSLAGWDSTKKVLQTVWKLSINTIMDLVVGILSLNVPYTCN